MRSVNKSKLLESAQKHLAKGNLDKAIKEYQKILKADANDTGVRLKTGELHERMGDRAQAFAEYRRVASTFTSQGFYSKAVAVLKRIQNADPDQIEIHLELAELNEKLGLLSEVVHHYQLAASVYDRKGEKRAAIDILKKVSEVGQSNLERKVKVAELYYKEGFPEAGFEQFVHAISELDPQSPEIVEIALRMCKASPEDPMLIERLGAIYLEQGDAKHAIEALEQARAMAEEASTVELLAQAKLQVELPGEAKTLLQKALTLYEARDERAKVREINARLTEMEEQALDGPDEPPGEYPAGGNPAEEGPAEARTGAAEGGGEDAAAAEGEPAPEEAAEGVEGPDEGAAPEETAASGGDEDAADAAAEDEEDEEGDELSEDERLEVAFSEAEVYRKYGKMEGAARVLESVAKRFPHRHEPRIRLKEIYEATRNWAKVADQCRMLGLIASTRGDEVRSNRFLEEAQRALERLAGGGPAEVEQQAPADVSGASAPGPGSAPASPEVPVAPAAKAAAQAAEPSPPLEIRIDDERLDEEASPPSAGASATSAPTTPPPDPMAAIEDTLIRSDAFRTQEPPDAPPDPAEPVAEGAGEGGGEEELDLELVIDDEGANPEGLPLSAERGIAAGTEPVDPLALSPPDDLEATEAGAPDASTEEVAPPGREADAGDREPASAAREGALPDAPISEEIDPEPATLPAGQEDIADGAPESTVPDAPMGEEVDLKRAELLASQGDIAAAAALYGRAVEAWPEDPAVRARHASLLDRLGDAPGDGEIPEAGGEAAEESVDAGEPAGPDELADAGETDELAEAGETDEPADAEEGVVLLDEVQEEDPSWDWVSTNGRLSTSNELGEAPAREIGEEPEAGAAGPEEAPALGEPAPGAPPPEQSAFDLRAVLMGDPDAPDTIGDVSDATLALNDLVTELQKEEQAAHAGLDAQTHYDLGVAYKEMGLLDEAIRELSIAAKDPTRRVECHEVIGVCHREQGRPEEAVRILEKCLGDGAASADATPGLLYEMALAQEAMGNLGEALDWYEKVLGIDPHFGDAGIRIAALRETGESNGPGQRTPGPFEGEGTDDIEEMLDDLETDS